jgi:phospholipid/cholesterol/gamma-HCH transport system substrate-binding protein
MRLRLTSRRLAAAAAAALAGTVFAVAVVGSGGGGESHHVYVTVRDATNVIAGQEVRAAGQKVGVIAAMDPIRRGRAVRLELRLEDTAWPLPQGTRFALRWGGTISYSNRFIALRRGPTGAPAIPDGSTIPASSFTLPVEYDQLVGTFTPKVRRDLKTLIHRGGVAFTTARPDLRRALAAAPPAVTQASAVMRDLAADQRALDTLVRSSDGVVGAVHAADPGIGRLVSGAATTFDTTAREVTALRATLHRTPGTLAAVRRTLAHADGTLAAAADLTDRLAPGVTQVRKLASPLNSVLGTVVRVAPDAKATLATARRATPDLNPLLTRATRLMPQLGSIGRQSVAQLKCIRPYTPDIVAFFTNWGDFLSPTDGKDKYIRANVQMLTPAPFNAIEANSGEIAKAFPGLRYAFPRPPGYNAGQPWFLPECGAGPEALDPSKDPEARR